MLARQVCRLKHYALIYKYVPDMAQKRTPFREKHVAYAKEHENKGLLLGGALQNPVDTGILLFDADENTVIDYAKNDPYTKNGLVAEYSVREIMFAFGAIKPK